MDGIDWIKYNDGINFEGNSDQNTQVQYDLVPLRALALRIVVHSWYSGIAMRFGAYCEIEC